MASSHRRPVVILAAGTLLAAAAGFSASIVFARTLGPTAYGKLATALTTANLLLPLAGAGVGALWYKLFGEEGAGARRWVGVSTRLVAATAVPLALAAAVIGAALAPDAESLHAGLMVAPLIIAGAFVSLLMARYKIEEKYVRFVIVHLYHNGSRFAVAVLAALAGGGVVLVSYGLGMIALLVAAGAFVAVLRAGRTSSAAAPPAGLEAHGSDAESASVKAVGRKAWPYAAMGVLYMVFFQSDILMLRFLQGPEAVAQYGVAATVISATFMLPGVIFQKYLLPKIHRWAYDDTAKLRRVYAFCLRYMSAGGAGLGIALFLLASPLIGVLFGASYAEATAVLMILAFAVPARYVGSVVGAVMSTGDRVYSKVRIMAAGAAINILLNLALIPVLGAAGAAVSTVASEATVAALQHLAFRRTELATTA